MNSNNCSLYGERKSGGQHGDVFTSPIVVRFMLDKVGYTSDLDLSHISILEPSCGDGEFVEEIAKRLIQSADRFGFDASEAFCRNVRAYDIDKEKIEKCRNRVCYLGIVFSENSIQVADFLKAEVERTDIVVGNPPYIRYENIPRICSTIAKRCSVLFIIAATFMCLSLRRLSLFLMQTENIASSVQIDGLKMNMGRNSDC